MRNRILFSLAGLALLLVGGAGGIFIGNYMSAQAAASQHYTVHAGSSQLSKYCATYEQALANDLHLSPSTLEQANIDAMTQVLDQMVTDGQITSTERDQLVPLLKKLGVSPCTQLSANSVASAVQGNSLLVQQALAAHAALSQAVANALHMTPDALASALAAGKTVPQLAQQQKVDIGTVRTAYLTAAKSFLSQAVGSKVITQPQADALNKLLTAAVAKDSYPLLAMGSLSGQGQ